MVWADVILLADDEDEETPVEAPSVNIPSRAWDTPPEQVSHWADKAVQYSMWLGIGVAVLAAIIFGAMIAIDRNKGEAGIAMSTQARVVKHAFGVGMIVAAPGLVKWILTSIN